MSFFLARFFLVAIAILAVSCSGLKDPTDDIGDDSSSNPIPDPPPTPTPPSTKKEINSLVITFSGQNYDVINSGGFDDQKAITFKVPFGLFDNQGRLATGESVISSMTISSGATLKDLYNNNKLSNESTITIENKTIKIQITAENGNAQTNTINFEDKFQMSSYTKSAFLGPGINDSTFRDSDPVLWISNLADVSFNFSFNGNIKKTASGGRLVLVKSDLNLNGLNNDTILTISANSVSFNLVTYKSLEIRSWKDLQAMRNGLNKSYLLKTNIVFPDPGQDNFPMEGFEPIGSQAQPFTGNFDGEGYVIDNFFIKRTTANIGLFGYINNTETTIRDVLLKHKGISGNDFVGSFVGRLFRGKLENVGMESSYIISNYGDHTGGLVGEVDNQSFVYGFSKGKVVAIGGRVGGLVGWLQDGGEVAGYSTGDVVGGTHVGGLVGYLQGKVSGYATGNVFGRYNTGGLFGELDNGTNPSISYFRGSVTRTNGTSDTFGLIAGVNTSGTFNGFHVTGASVNGVTAPTGVSGTALTFDDSVNQATFTSFTFGTAIGEWTFETGKWPAINIGTLTGANAGDQPITP